MGFVGRQGEQATDAAASEEGGSGGLTFMDGLRRSGHSTSRNRSGGKMIAVQGIRGRRQRDGFKECQAITEGLAMAMVMVPMKGNPVSSTSIASRTLDETRAGISANARNDVESRPTVEVK